MKWLFISGTRFLSKQSQPFHYFTAYILIAICILLLLVNIFGIAINEYFTGASLLQI